MDEGVVKFRCTWEPGPPLPEADVADLERWRGVLRARGLLGHDPRHDVGFGNLSARLPDHGIVISGTQTGHLERLGGAHYVRLVAWDLEANRVTCRGPVRASSESLTHLALYALDAAVGAVLHVHSAALWGALRDRVPTSAEDVPYGTVAMAREFARLWHEADLAKRRIAVMAGHADGVVSFGRDLDEAGAVLLGHLERHP